MWTVMDSPVGELRIVERNGAVVAIEFSPFRPPSDGRPLGARDDDHPVLKETVRQLTAYFLRDLKEFDLPLAPDGTDFQRRVWDQLLAIAYVRYRYMRTPLLQTVLQVIFGGALVFAVGLWLGRLGAGE